MFHEKQSYAVWIEAECWVPGSWIPNDANTDVIVTYEDGSRWAATFVSYQNVQTLREKNQKSGESLSGSYFWATSMILVDEVSRQRVEQVICDLLSIGQFEAAFTAVPTDEERMPK
ncbi:MAG: hypothetical protein WCD86_05365 [Ktedonobacteraceae bacterium]